MSTIMKPAVKTVRHFRADVAAESVHYALAEDGAAVVDIAGMPSIEPGFEDGSGQS